MSADAKRDVELVRYALRYAFEHLKPTAGTMVLFSAEQALDRLAEALERGEGAGGCSVE